MRFHTLITENGGRRREIEQLEISSETGLFSISFQWIMAISTAELDREGKGEAARFIWVLSYGRPWSMVVAVALESHRLN
ncbi:unnamed protein product [Prunus armeniaca]